VAVVRILSSIMKSKLILASASLRRSKILKELGLTFEVIIPDVDEVHWNDDPVGTVEENAKRKCNCISQQYPDMIVIAADTVVVFDGKCLGKPKTIQEAREMLGLFSGKSQTVYSGIAIATPQESLDLYLEKSEVHFRKISDTVIDQYFSLVDPLDKAGGYDIDQHSDLIISGYDGSWTNIMGLPKEIIEKILCK